MEELKLGDIRKFDNGIIGVVSNTSNGPFYEVIEPNGEKRMIPKSCSFTIPKLKPEVRSMLNAVSDAIINCEEKKRAVSQAYVESSRATDRLNEVITRLKTFGQGMTLKEFEKLLISKLGSKYNKLCDMGYIIELSFNANSLDLRLHYRTMVKKYATPENTTYVSRSYDDGICLEWTSGGYKSTLEKYSRLTPSFIVEGLNGAMASEDKSLSVADKNSIMFNHEVHYCYLDGKLTDEMATLVAKNVQIYK